MGILTRNGYRIEKSAVTNVRDLSKRLTAKPVVPKVFNPWGSKSYKVFEETDSYFYLPKHAGISEFGQPTELLCIAESTDPSYWEFAGGLRPSQVEVVNSYLKPEPRDGLICLQTGGGKTVCALHIASELKVKTIILVHNSFLRDQWIDRIKAFLPKARIGTIQGDVIDTDCKDIIIAMIQTISMKDLPKSTFSGIGLTIIDECHHIASEVFVRAFPKITSKHMLGLSATPERKDMLMHVINWFLGPILYRSDTGDKVDTGISVEVYHYDVNDPEFNKIIYNASGVMFTSLMINKLTEYEARTRFLSDIISDVMEDQTRQMLVLSDRVDHCKSILAALPESLRDMSAILSRDIKSNQRAEWCASKRILISTYQLCKEGFDVPTLNTLVMASPRPDVDQIVGRILRIEKEKRQVHPLIIDIIDTAFRRQFQERNGLYKKREYKVEIMKLT